MPTTVDITATVDTGIESNNATTNRGAQAGQNIGRFGGGFGAGRILVRCDISSISRDVVITAAEFWGDISGASGSPEEWAMYRVMRTWVEGDNGAGSGATWNTYDGTNNWTTAGCSGLGTDYTTADGPNDYTTGYTRANSTGVLLLHDNVTAIVKDALIYRSGSISALFRRKASDGATDTFSTIRTYDYNGGSSPMFFRITYEPLYDVQETRRPRNMFRPDSWRRRVMEDAR